MIILLLLYTTIIVKVGDVDYVLHKTLSLSMPTMHASVSRLYHISKIHSHRLLHTVHTAYTLSAHLLSGSDNLVAGGSG